MGHLRLRPYGGRANPFDQRDASDTGYGGPVGGRAPGAFGQGPRPGGGGGAPRYNQAPAMGRDDYGSGNVEMASLAQNAGSFGQGDPNAILNECRSISAGIDQVERNLAQLKQLQDKSLNEADSSSGSSANRQLNALSSETMAMYRALTDRIRKIKSDPESRQARNVAQVNNIDRRIKAAIQDYQRLEADFRQRTQAAAARQYKIVKPDASDAEVREAVEDLGNANLFQQALMQSNRMGQANAVLSAVRDRHEALKKIEQQIIELAQLFQDLDTLVMQQGEVITEIEQKTEEVVENLDKGNEEMDVAIKTAKSTRKKKWWCLGICVAIVVIIAVAVTAYILINHPPGGSNNTTTTTTAAPTATSSSNSASTTTRAAKRSVADDLQMNTARSVEFDGERPVSRVYAQSKIVVPNSEFDADAGPLATFAGSGRAHGLTSKGRMARRRGLTAPPQHAEDEASAIKRWVVSDNWPGEDDAPVVNK
ncbi:syntaxin [Diplogelasinospora grovesii]|uniref:Syntaxin n=1 Tax=Diplogelasinospora grovesii TaxID=303347 RepID=A0AAN6MZ99_9PEZI|nr:syntaxin [Diplogelasinospora grovesii]